MKIKALFCRCLPPNSPINPILRNLPPSTFFSKDVRKLPPLPISTTKTKETYLLAWGTLSTQGNVILSGVVCVPSVRPSVCPSVVTNRVTGQNLRTSIGIGLLFFLKVAYHWGEVQSKNKFGKRCEKKVWNRQKRCEITNMEEFSIENLCKSYIFL